MSAPVYAPFIVAPPLTCCEHAYLVYGQGTPPYDINVISTGDANGTSLEAIPRRDKDGVVRWRVDFNEGANITFALTDGSGQQAYSQYRVVQAGEVTTCSKTAYSSHDDGPNVGGIVGGLLGALVLLALFGLLIWFRRRRLRKRRELLAFEGKSSSDVRLADGPAGLTRAGTFNLGNVRFTEESLDHLRAIDRPPNYDEARAAREEREAAATAAAAAATAEEGPPSPPSTVTATGAELPVPSGGAQHRIAPPVPGRRRERAVRDMQERKVGEGAERLVRDHEEAVEATGSSTESRRISHDSSRRSEEV
ncbi:hypothetical protein JCM11251_007307 [Rhodosporidiobolus azoricus]